MPKESIFSDHGPFTIQGDGAEIQAKYLEPGQRHPIYERAVMVGWSKAGTNSEGAVTVGAVLLNPSDDSLSEGVHLSLDRSGINRLIRALRRARDQAFGADA